MRRRSSPYGVVTPWAFMWVRTRRFEPRRNFIVLLAVGTEEVTGGRIVAQEGLSARAGLPTMASPVEAPLISGTEGFTPRQSGVVFRWRAECWLPAALVAEATVMAEAVDNLASRERQDPSVSLGRRAVNLAESRQAAGRPVQTVDGAGRVDRSRAVRAATVGVHTLRAAAGAAGGMAQAAAVQEGLPVAAEAGPAAAAAVGPDMSPRALRSSNRLLAYSKVTDVP